MNTCLLVADDDPLMRTLVAVTFTDVADVVEAADGTETLHLLREARFDLLLLDWDMPGANGLEVLTAMRRMGCDTPTIMVTGKNERGEVIRAIQAGVADYLVKPFESDALYAKVKKLCAFVPARKPPAPNDTTHAIDEETPHAEDAVFP